ncbi:TetR/AcrR family transcriptional regulator [Phaeobacter sp. PT47_59]|uniref:TetR/AcrR family transcriptional regulator n=1 Tax=Phaeobacter sp. PT47_59 TaxID=3029979 RepID=UPI0023803597|nr:TetR/AcrR family transcriptional regulator [Phaeobacter sp. PT47_59]MDE4174498.1 TetR/AcrR family transcriptional regulator [Phaeobacter sp. PT47_59]
MTVQEENTPVFGRLKTRETPKQARAVQRIHLILATTAQLLTELPLNAITTTLIAHHAGIPVSSIYRYFTDVTHVLRELYLQSAQELRDRALETLEDTETWPGWRDRLRHIITTQRDHIQHNPFYPPLLMHFVSLRPTVAAEDSEREYLTDMLETRWKRGADGFRGGDPKVVAHTVLQIAVTMEDLTAAQKDSYRADVFAEETLTVLGCYLANYLRD